MKNTANRSTIAIFGILLACILATWTPPVSAQPKALCPFDHGNASLGREGLLFTRYALGLRGAGLVSGTGLLASQADAAAASFECATCGAQIDINGNGVFDAVDAAVIARKIAGFKGTELTAGLQLGAGTRNTAQRITDFVNSGCPVSTPVELLAVGDIAYCQTTPAASGAMQTGNLIRRMPGIPVLTLGDNAYLWGLEAEFANCFEPTWGSEKARLRPSPGNHDYGNITPFATGYYNYFGPSAGPDSRGYYSFDLGDWHIVSLNSLADVTIGSPQERWLRDDLRNTSRQCILAYWHYPVFTSSPRGDSPIMRDIWRTLEQFRVSVILTGHEHNYERFAKQTADGVLDPVNGIRQFIVGTGGIGMTPSVAIKPNSEKFNALNFGVLKLTLGSNSYAWEFVPTVDGVIVDSGSSNCR